MKINNLQMQYITQKWDIFSLIRTVGLDEDEIQPLITVFNTGISHASTRRIYQVSRKEIFDTNLDPDPVCFSIKYLVYLMWQCAPVITFNIAIRNVNCSI